MARCLSIAVILAVAAVHGGRACAAEAASALDRATATLADWNASASDRSAAFGALRNAGEGALQQIRTLLKSPVWLARRDAVQLAAALNLSDIVAILTEAAKDRNWAVRSAAAGAAGASIILTAPRRPAVEAVLKSLLADQIPKVRLSAYQALAGQDADSQYVAQALADADPEVSYWAAQHLMKKGQPGNLPAETRAKLADSIIARFQGSRWRNPDNLGVATIFSLGPAAANALHDALIAEPADVRRNAVSNIGNVAGKAGVPLMFRMMTDADPSVRSYAMGQIATRCDESDAPRLLDILNSASEPEVRHYAVSALGRVRYKKAVPILLRLAGGQEQGVRQSAVAALAQMGDKSIAPRLIQMFQNERQNWLRGQMVNPIAQLLGTDALDFLKDAVHDDDQSVRTYALYAAKSFLKDDDKTEFLLKAIKDEEEDNVRQAAISSLDETQAGKAVDLLSEVLRDGGPQSRRAAAYMLSRVRTPAAAKLLIDAYDKEDDPNIREAIISALSQVQDRRVVPVFQQALKSTDARMRAAALNALSRFPDVLTDDVLVALMRNEDDEQVLHAALNLLANRPTADARLLPRLVKLLDSTDDSVRLSAVTVIARVEGDESLAALCKAIKEDNESSIRSSAVNAVVQRISERKVTVRSALKSLEQALETNELRSREQIIAALAALNDRELAPLLLKTLRNDAADSVRAAAAEGIRRIADKPMVPQLLEAAKGEEKPATLVVLINILGALGDRSAVPFLQASLRSTEPSVQAAALNAIGSFREGFLVPFYIERFKAGTSPDVRLTSLRNLQGAGDRRAAEILPRALKDDDPRIRSAALDLLADLPDPALVTSLVDELCAKPSAETAPEPVLRVLAETRLRTVADKLLDAARKTTDRAPRETLLKALARTGDRRAAPLLAAALRDSPSVELTLDALDALGKLGARDQAPLCLSLARETSGSVSLAATAAAVRLDPGPDVSAYVLSRFRTCGAAEKRSLAALLPALGPAGESALCETIEKNADPRVTAAAIAALPARRPDAGPLLRRMALADLPAEIVVPAIRKLSLDLLRDPANFAEGLRVLGAIRRSGRSAEVRAAATDRLFPALANEGADQVEVNSPETAVAVVSLRAVGFLVDPTDAMTRAVIEQARAGIESARRTEAVRALGRLKGSKEAEDLLLAILDKQDDAALQNDAVIALGNLKSAAAVERLAKLVTSAPLPVSESAVEALAHIGTPPAWKAVEDGFRTSDVDRVRAAAALALAGADRADLIPVMVEALKTAPGLRVRAACAAALGAFKADPARAALLDALRQDSGVVREAALRAMKTADRAALDEVRKCGDDPDSAVAAAAREALARLSEGRTP